ncbi:MAG: hypothetical protein AAF527_07615 [Pseudomonadota bacterium]
MARFRISDSALRRGLVLGLGALIWAAWGAFAPTTASAFDRGGVQIGLNYWTFADDYYWRGHPRRSRRFRRRYGYGYDPYDWYGYRGRRYRGNRARGGDGENCRPAIREGQWRGRPARIGGTVCIDGFGNRRVIGEHAVEYLDGEE